ncbi:hypothetical protein P7C70_g3780, partial [Phenoliferia sp. Uapishka_3]
MPSSMVSDTTMATPPSPKQHHTEKDSSREDSPSPVPHERAAEVQELARQLSRVSTLNRHHKKDGEFELSPFDEQNDDKRLDPNSPEFDVRTWISSIVHHQRLDPERYPQRTAGVSFSNLNAFGFGSSTDYQKTVGNACMGLWAPVARAMGIGKKLTKIRILRDFEGLLESGEMLIVLGRPGSGCSTFLKTIAGDTHGFYLEEGSNLQYQGIPAKTMHSDFRGEVILSGETDVHFPMLTVGETLAFGTSFTPCNVSQQADPAFPQPLELGHRETGCRVSLVRNLLSTCETLLWRSMASFTCPSVPFKTSRLTTIECRTVTHAIGRAIKLTPLISAQRSIRRRAQEVVHSQKKLLQAQRLTTSKLRVSIAEVTLSGSPLQCWDNSTRGLDSANALEFVRTLRLGTQSAGFTAAVAIYQASQSAYDIFDKVIVLYAGYEIFYGRCDSAKEFFTSRGYLCPPRQTTADFLTSLTNPAERVVAPGWESLVPRTPEEFAKVWKESPERAKLLIDIKEYEAKYPLGGENLERFRASRKASQAKHMSSKDPYTISIPMQVQLCMVRGFQRLKNDQMNLWITVLGNFFMGLIVASVFYNLAEDTSSFYSRGALLFFAILMNAFQSALEILTLYDQRPIVEKHHKFALYHPFAEAISSMLCDMPSKILVAISFNLAIYFMTNLRREPGPFFFFLLISFFTTLTMSSIFRTIAASSRTLQGALAPAAVFILGLVIYTGFALPTTSMHGWSRWMNWLDPVAYAFEALMVNEFHNRVFPCVAFVPTGAGFENATGTERSCSTVGSVAGSSVVNGDRYINESFQYYHAHKWRNFGILVGFWIFFTCIYLAATEFISAQRSKGEVLVFRQGHRPAHLKNSDDDEENGATEVQVREDNADPNEKVNIHRQTATFHWEDLCYDIKIKGVGRRILSNVDGWVKPGKFKTPDRSFSAALIRTISTKGASGAGKTTLLDVLANRVTMGVITGSIFGQLPFSTKDLHLATATVRESLNFSALCRQPKSTPRSEKLAYVEEVIKILEMEDYAEAVVGVPGEGLNVEQRKRLTIGVELAAKPDLLLFLDEPSSGLDSQTAWSMVRLCRKLANSGQAILCTIHQPSAILMAEFDRLLFLQKGGRTVYFGEIGPNCSTLVNYFEAHGAEPCPPEDNPAEWMLQVIGAAPGSHTTIEWHDTWRESEEYKQVHLELEALKAHRGPLKQSEGNESDALSGINEFAMPLAHQLWYCFWRVWAQYWRTPSYIYAKTARRLLTLHHRGDLCAPTQSPTPAYTDASNVQVGFSFYNEANTSQGLQNEMYDQKSFLCAAVEVAEVGGIIYLPSHVGCQNLDYLLLQEPSPTLRSHLVLATPKQFPYFWIFLYRLSPFTYLISGMLTTAVSGAALVCSDVELVTVTPPPGETCLTYLGDYLTSTGGALYTNGSSTSSCSFCTSTSTDSYLNTLGMSFDTAWRNYGLMWAYVVFNICAAAALYWLARVPKKIGAETIKKE